MSRRLSREHYGRRQAMILLGALAAASGILAGRPAAADVAAMRAWMQEILGDRTAQEGRIVLDLPEIAENGNTVPLAIEVDSPMTEDDHVTAVHIMTESNPDPEVATFYFTPRNGRAVVATRIRLSESQKVHALAEMSDGSVYKTARDVEVTIGGCGG